MSKFLKQLLKKTKPITTTITQTNTPLVQLENKMIPSSTKTLSTLQQSPNSPTTWFPNQQPKNLAMTGPRFEQHDLEAQPDSYSAMELISHHPIQLSTKRVVSCDGGGGALGHPKIFINLDREKDIACDFTALSIDEIQPTLKEEPLLKENPQRFVLFPIQYNAIWQAYKNVESKFWSAEEIEMGSDVNDFVSLQGKERSLVLVLISHLSFFAVSQLTKRLANDIQISEARCYYGFQMMQEAIHLEVCDLFTQEFTAKLDRDQNEEKVIVRKLVTGMGSTQARLAWLDVHINDSPKHFSQRTVAGCVYGYLSNCLQRTLLLHYTDYKFQGLIHALAKFRVNHQQNIDFGMLVGEHLINKVGDGDVKSMILSLCEIEKKSVDEIMEMNGGVIGVLGKTVDGNSLKIYIEQEGNKCFRMMLGGDALVYEKRVSGLEWIDVKLAKEIGKFVKVEVKVKIQAGKSAEAVKEVGFSMDEDF